MTQFSKVAYDGGFSGGGAGTDSSGDSGTATVSGGVTAVLTENADGSITGTYTYSGSDTLSNEFGSEPGPSFSGQGTVSGSQTGGLVFTNTSGPFAIGNASISSNDTTITFSNAPWTFSDDGFVGSGTVTGTLTGSPPLPPIVSWDSGSLSADAGTTITYTLSRGPIPIGDTGAVVDVSAVDGTAVQGVDYELLTSQVTFVSSQTTAPVQVELIQDAADAAAHISPDFELELTAVSNATIGLGTVQTTIIESSSSIISSGQTLTISPGQNLSGLTVESGGTLDILSGGTATGLVDSGGKIDVSSGGVAIATTLAGGGEQDVLFGGTAVSTTISSGGLQVISSGGLGSTTIVLSGGSNRIASGGTDPTTIFAGGVETISAGGTDTGAQISGGSLLDYGFAPDATVYSGGTEIVEAGATASGFVPIVSSAAGGTTSAATIGAGGTQIIEAGATAIDNSADVGATVSVYGLEIDADSLGGSTFVYSGGTDSGTGLFGAVETIESGATGIGITVSFREIRGGNAIAVVPGTLTVDGTAINTAIGLRGGELVESGGVASGATIGDGGAETVQSGGTLAALTEISGGNLELSGGADVTGTFLFAGSGGLLQFDSATLPSAIISGFAVSDVIDLTAITFSSSGNIALRSGNVLQITEGGSSYSLTLQSNQLFIDENFALLSGASGETEVVLVGEQVTSSAIISRGEAYGLQIAGGGVALVLSGGSASGTTVSSGGEQYIGSSGTATGAQVEGGGAEVVFGTDSGASLSGTSSATATQYDFGIALGGTTFEDGFQQVAPGAVASGMTVEYGGEQYVGSGGTTLGAQIEAGGAEVVFGIDSGASLSGTQYDFGTASGGTTYNGGYQLVAPGATAIGMTVESGGQQYIGSGGTAIATTIAPQGAEVVFGTDSGALISGTQYDFAVASGGTTYNGGFQLVAPGAVAIGMNVESGGQQYIGAGGTALATDIAPQGAEVIFGSDSGALNSGTQYVFGIASGGTTFDGGSQQVEPDGTAIGMTVSSGGLQYVGAGGTAIGTDIMSRGAEVVHGTDLGASISGTQYVDGLASGTVVDSGGYQLVSAGGTISAASIDGGTIELQSGASDGAAPITFTSAGELILDASAQFSGTIAGFGSASLNDSIDFADIPYVASGSAGATTLSWTQLTSGANGSGTLLVSDGGHSADITLFGQYMAGNFTLSSAGNGGTLVTDPPVIAATDRSPVVLTTAHQA